MQLTGDSFFSFCSFVRLIHHQPVRGPPRRESPVRWRDGQAMKVAKKQLILLSESSKRKASSASGLVKIGIDAVAFSAAKTWWPRWGRGRTASPCGALM